MIDVLSKSEASKSTVGLPPSLHLLTLADTEISEDIVRYARGKGVLVTQRKAELVEDPNTHEKSIRTGFQVVLNPDVMAGRGDFAPPTGIPTEPAPLSPG
jgi:hypothetical protein